MFHKQTAKNGMEYYSSSLIDAPHAFSLKTSWGNYDAFADAVGIAPENYVFAKQVHSDIILSAGKADRGRGLRFPAKWECDGLITDEPGLALTVFSADCVPILLYAPDSHAVAAVHSGWRGTKAEIARKAVEGLISLGAGRIFAAIGPCICNKCFEVREDVAREFPDRAQKIHGAHWRVNLREIVAEQLRPYAEVDVCDLCTCCDKEFYSHRRDGSSRGLQCSVIQLSR